MSSGRRMNCAVVIGDGARGPGGSGITATVPARRVNRLRRASGLRLGLEGDRARRAVRRGSVREGHVGRDGEFTRERVLPGLAPERAVRRDAVGGLGAVRERLVVAAGALELAPLDRNGVQAGEPEVDVRVVALRGPVDELPL